MFHIVFSSDDGYIKYLATLITSIIKNTHKESTEFINESYCFHILTNELTQKTLEQLNTLEQELNEIYPCQIQIHTLKDDEFHGLPKLGYDKNKSQNYLTYYRIKLANFIPQDISICLYLDVDMLVLCDLRELFSIPINNHVAAVVLDNFIPKRKLRSKVNPIKNSLINTTTYFNAGMMLINLIEWRKQSVESKCLQFLSQYLPKSRDQDTLNVILENKTLILPPKWNILVRRLAGEKTFKGECKNYVINYSRKEYEDSIKNIKIVHYTGESKPWISPYQSLENYLPTTYPFRNEWWEYAKQTPSFSKELLEIQKSFEEYKLDTYIATIAPKLQKMEKKIWSIRHPIAALISYLKQSK